MATTGASRRWRVRSSIGKVPSKAGSRREGHYVKDVGKSVKRGSASGKVGEVNAKAMSRAARAANKRTAKIRNDFGGSAAARDRREANHVQRGARHR